MKINILADGHILTAGRGTGRRAAAWLLALALAAAALLSTTALFAEILDDFSDPVKSEQIWNGSVWFGTGDQLVTNGQVRISITPFGDHGFSGLDSVRTFTLREGRTLEFRTDLVSSSGDGAVARLGFFFTDVEAGYVFNLDQDTISLLKRENPFQLFLLTNDVPIDVTNVKLVVSMTGVQTNVLVQLKILDNERPGRVVYATDLWDTPNRDPMQVGTDDPPGNFLGRAGKFYLGVYHDNVGWLDPVVEIPSHDEAEVVFDNAEVLEYDSVWMAPSSTAVLLSWPENTAEEQIVVGASSLASNAVWAPWPEPIFKRFGELCLAVPTAATQQFFKLVPGTQFIDDFDPPKPPYASKGDWAPYFYDSGDSGRIEVANTGSALRIRAVTAPADGQGFVLPPGPDVIVGDFHVSVDLLEMAGAAEKDGIALGARGWRDPDRPFPGQSIGYLGGILLYPPGSARLFLFDGEFDPGGPLFELDPAADYRLRFSGVGNALAVRLVNLTDPTAPVQERLKTDTKFQQGLVGLWVQARSSSYAFTLDHFFATGTKP